MEQRIQASDALNQGIAALKGKRFDEAEDYLLAAFQICQRARIARTPDAIDSGWTACYFLGRVYRLTGRYDEAVNVLEKALPLPAAFKELVSIFRFLGKVAKQENDEAARLG